MIGIREGSWEGRHGMKRRYKEKSTAKEENRNRYSQVIHAQCVEASWSPTFHYLGPRPAMCCTSHAGNQQGPWYLHLLRFYSWIALFPYLFFSCYVSFPGIPLLHLPSLSSYPGTPHIHRTRPLTPTPFLALLPDRGYSLLIFS